jgi:hypothetical protein
MLQFSRKKSETLNSEISKFAFCDSDYTCCQGVTGKNVTTAIMDDGVDYMHPDLINNFVSTIDCIIIAIIDDDGMVYMHLDLKVDHSL